MYIIYPTFPNFNYLDQKKMEEIKKKLKIQDKIKILVKFDENKFLNKANDKLFIRGSGHSSLSWKKGIELKKLPQNTWIFE